MSYRLISSNDIAIKYPEVNDMPCIYADLPNGMDGEHYVLEQEPKTGHWIYKQYGSYPEQGDYHCSECDGIDNRIPAYCPNCGCRMVDPQESEVRND